MKLSPRFILKEVLIVGVIFAVVYVGNQYVQSWLGEKAIEKTGFEHIALDEALTRAAAEDKLVLVDFAAVWCAACRKLDNRVLAESTVQSIINEKYIFARIDYDSDQALFDKYGIQGVPTLLLLDAQGNRVRQLHTTYDADLFSQQL